MASWKEIRCWLESRSVTYVGGDEWAGVCWPPESTLPGMTTVVNVVLLDKDHVVASAHVASQEMLSIRDFLRWHARLRGGGLVFQRGEVFVRSQMDLGAITLEDLARTLTRLADHASSIRTELSSVPGQ